MLFNRCEDRMRPLRAGACLLWLFGLTGCPHAFGRGGTIDRAVHKDTEDNLSPPECTEDVYKELCVDGGKEKAEACLEVCGQ